MDRHLLSPMYNAGTCHYYIDEPARLVDGRTVVPVRWLDNEEDGEVVADAWLVETDENVSVAVITSINHSPDGGNSRLAR